MDMRRKRHIKAWYTFTIFVIGLLVVAGLFYSVITLDLLSALILVVIGVFAIAGILYSYWLVTGESWFKNG